MDTKKLRQKILDLAIRGKLVPQDPNDEPASVLLERIIPEFEICDNEECPYETPKSWKFARLEDLCEFIRNGVSIRQIKGAKGYPITRIETISNCIIDRNRMGYADIEDDTYEKYYLQNGDILMSHINSPIHVGKSAIYEYIEGEKIIHGMNLLCLRMKSIICPKYINHFFYSGFFRNEIRPYVKNAVNQASLNTRNLGSVLVPIPPYQEQLRIVDKIEQWFALMDILENEKSDLQASILQAKSKILDLAIHGKLAPQDLNDEPAIELLKRINPKFEACDNELDTTQLPDSWCWTTLGSLFNHNTGKALNKSDLQEGSLLPYITTSNVYWNCFDLSEIKKMFFKDSEIDKCTVTKGDLLVCEGGDIGRSAIWGYDYDICIQNHIHRLRAKGDVSHLLYLYVLMFYKWTDKIRGKGIGLQGLSSGLLDKMVVPLPPYQEQLRIVAKIEELFAVLDSIKESLE